ncbi:hypothetical protein C8F04DRAFT_631285 [Mycena alexandri]|uniref:LysM domain-containing protein n=1 Tax=Mycena alexandri TaxID=1745969 RepID=A0AAD6X5R5_9AGAR|nr:hypothetical protein C8F04DRAFT_631285 [Mycena alexandri]
MHINDICPPRQRVRATLEDRENDFTRRPFIPRKIRSTLFVVHKARSLAISNITAPVSLSANMTFSPSIILRCLSILAFMALSLGAEAALAPRQDNGPFSALVNCSEFIQVVQGDTCSSLGATYGFNDAQFNSLNQPSNITCSNLQPGDIVCVRGTA